MANVIPDPDFEGFDGIYAGSKDITFRPPPNKVMFSDLINYMKSSGKSFSDLTEEEIKRFTYG